MISVAHSVEYDRVAALPRRVLSLDTATELARQMTLAYALDRSVALRPWQATSLAEAQSCGGAWLALPVGQGKTLICWLLPSAMQSRRTLLIVPGSLAEKTRHDFHAYYGQWRAPRAMRIETRERLSIMSGADLLEQHRPDLIIIDESDDLANAKSAASRRIDRYIRSHPSVRVVAMSGTPSRKSLMAYWHTVAWCLGDRAPLPLDEGEARMWDLALGDHRGPRPKPGPLGATLRQARDWYRRRLVESPGVVVIDEDSCDAPLTVRVRIAREDPEIDRAFETFLTEQETPSGIPISDPLSLWLLGSQLGLGLYSRWDPPPPDVWRDARREVAAFVRVRIAQTTHATRPLDTEAQVLRRHADHPIVQRWADIKPTFAGATETVWFSRSALDSCHDWLREIGDEPGIVWCGSVAFGRALARESRLPYFGRQGRTDDGHALHQADRVFPRMVCSWNANKKGFNLQAWRRQLIVMPPQSAKWYEQIFGRCHRSGQQEHVIVDVLATSGGTLDAFEAAIQEATTVSQTVSLTPKLLRATIERAAPVVDRSNEYRWARRDHDCA